MLLVTWLKCMQCDFILVVANTLPTLFECLHKINFMQVAESFRTLTVSVPVVDPPVSVSEPAPFPTFLGTQPMKMIHGPIKYFPFSNIALNFTSMSKCQNVILLLVLTCLE